MRGIRNILQWTAIIMALCIFSQNTYAYTRYLKPYDLGDVDMDGNITANDAAIVYQHVLNGSYPDNPFQQHKLMFQSLSEVVSGSAITADNAARILNKCLNNNSVYNRYAYNFKDIAIGEYTQTTVIDEHITLIADEDNPMEIFQRAEIDQFYDEFPQAARLIYRNDKSNYIKVTLTKPSKMRFLMSYEQPLPPMLMETKPDRDWGVYFENSNHEVIDCYYDWLPAYMENLKGRRGNYILLDDILPVGDYYLRSGSELGVHVEEIVIYELD